MRHRLLLSPALHLALLVSVTAPSSAGTRIYDLDGDFSTYFPVDGTVLRPSPVTGVAIIENGPRLTELSLTSTFSDLLSSTITSAIPGTTTTLDLLIEIRPDLSSPPLGTGSVDTSIEWGALTGWTQTGRTVCITHCPGGCPTGVSICIPLVGFEGTGPSPPLANASFDTDPWTFAGDASGGGFEAPSLQFVNLTGGVVTMSDLPRGTLRPVVPALPLAGIAALAGALTYLAARALGRRE